MEHHVQAGAAGRGRALEIAGHCERIGRDFTSITRSSNYNIAIGRTEKEVADRLAWIRDRYISKVGPAKAEAQLSEFIWMPGVGTPARIVAKLSAHEGGRLDIRDHQFSELA